TKDPGASDPLVKNGLVGGKLYVLAATGATRDEAGFHKGDGTLSALSWAEIAEPAAKDADALEAAPQAANSFNELTRIGDEWQDAPPAIATTITWTGFPLKTFSDNVTSLFMWPPAGRSRGFSPFSIGNAPLALFSARECGRTQLALKPTTSWG